MIVWRGWGIVAPFIIAVCFGLMGKFGIIVGGALTAGLGVWLRENSKTQHELYWIPLNWLGVIVAAGGLVSYFV